MLLYLSIVNTKDFHQQLQIASYNIFVVIIWTKVHANHVVVIMYPKPDLNNVENL